jgi:hypothetical protein
MPSAARRGRVLSALSSDADPLELLLELSVARLELPELWMQLGSPAWEASSAILAPSRRRRALRPPGDERGRIDLAPGKRPARDTSPARRSSGEALHCCSFDVGGGGASQAKDTLRPALFPAVPVRAGESATPWLMSADGEDGFRARVTAVRVLETNEVDNAVASNVDEVVEIVQRFVSAFTTS